MFNYVHQKLRDYILEMQDVLPRVTSTLSSVTYASSASNERKTINYPHLYEELITFV
jgi:hypothetical protein